MLYSPCYKQDLILTPMITLSVTFTLLTLNLMCVKLVCVCVCVCVYVCVRLCGLCKVHVDMDDGQH
jgi:hypothetical protein